MSEAEVLQQSVNSCRDSLLTAIVQAKDRATIGLANETKAKSVNEELQSYLQVKEATKESINYITQIYKNVESYAQNRKELAMEMLKLAIRKAGNLVPNADVEDIELVVNEKKASIVNANGQDINMREGSAYRTVMGLLIRYTLLKEDPEAIQAMFFDEGFNTLSDETTVATREYFEVFKEDMIIVMIEQHNTIFQGLDCKQLHAIKGENGTIITGGN